jgi:hypothetical protein
MADLQRVTNTFTLNDNNRSNDPCQRQSGSSGQFQVSRVGGTLKTAGEINLIPCSAFFLAKQGHFPYTIGAASSLS